MPEYERSVTVPAAADAAFRFLADPANLPRYVATMVKAEPRDGDEVRVAAHVQGRHEEGDARLQADSGARRLEWGAAGAGGYAGRLEVTPSGEGSTVTLRLRVVRDADADEVDRALDETAANIERLLATL